jgi:class 3 adenylate cyclase
MTRQLDDLDQLLSNYHSETEEGIVDVVPSRLTRGQGTEKEFFILKIDLVNSTELMLKRRPSTYLRLAHTFLSAVDKITIDHGAVPTQTEYAGDSVLAYFPAHVGADQVLKAACLSRAAVVRIAALPGVVGELKPKCKVVLHYAKLIMARIGPRSASILSAIGYPIHRVAKLEKTIGPDVGWATVEFYQQVLPKHRHYLNPEYNERKEPVLVTEAPRNYDRNSLLAHALYGHQTPPITRIEYKTVRDLKGYTMRWNALNLFTGLVNPMR